MRAGGPARLGAAPAACEHPPTIDLGSARDPRCQSGSSPRHENPPEYGVPDALEGMTEKAKTLASQAQKKAKELAGQAEAKLKEARDSLDKDSKKG